jgi:putative salt-induced outer membrane protein YdiY
LPEVGEKMKFTVLFLLIVGIVSADLSGVEIRLKSGDVLSGDTIKSSDGNVTVPYFGSQVKIPMERIEKIILRSSYVVEMKDGSRQVGQSSVKEEEPGFLNFITASGLEIAMKPDEISSIQTQSSYEEQAKSMDKLGRYWEGSTDIGFASQSGNTEENKLYYLIKAKRRSKLDVFNMELSGTQGQSENTETSNSGKLKTRFDLLHRKDSFYFLLSSLEYDKIKMIDLRTVLGVGAGWTLWKNDRSKLQVSLGITYDKEQREDNTSNSATTGLFATEFRRALAGKSYLEGEMNFYPDLKDTDNLKADGRFSLVNPINGSMSFKLSLYEKYDETVLAGVEKLDTQIQTSLSYKF